MNISPFRLQDPHLKKEDGLEFYLGGSVPIPFPQDVISSLPMPRTPWPGSSCSLPQKSKQSTYMQIIELQTSFWFSSWGARCLGDDTCWQGHFLLSRGKKVSGDDSESDSYYLILFFDVAHPSSLYKLRSLNLSHLLPTCYLQHLCLFFPLQSESGRLCF